ncbi:MAG: hypothetical protein BWY89_01641 [Bacteroidetes bacterium ADurb.BinA012]|nr:MAG: hypothetical protein BWY89_01641 [Bacteroidetes bacterium ADurb.BinA012]
MRITFRRSPAMVCHWSRRMLSMMMKKSGVSLLIMGKILFDNTAGDIRGLSAAPAETHFM